MHLRGKGKVGFLSTVEFPVLCKCFMAALVLALRSPIRGKSFRVNGYAVSCVLPLDCSNHIKTETKNTDKNHENTNSFSVCQSHPVLSLKFFYL